MNRSRIPNASLPASVVLNSALVKKFAWFARNDGTARINRNSRDQHNRDHDRRTGSGGDQLEQPVAAPGCARSVRFSAGLPRPDRFSRAPLNPRVMRTSVQEMALTAVDNLDLNASGMGIYPLSAKPFWPAPMVLCRNAFTAVPTWASGYFEQTISYVASTIG